MSIQQIGGVAIIFISIFAGIFNYRKVKMYRINSPQSKINREDLSLGIRGLILAPFLFFFGLLFLFVL